MINTVHIMANSDFTVQYDGLKNGESGANVVTGLQVGTAAEKDSPPVCYDITPGSSHFPYVMIENIDKTDC